MSGRLDVLYSVCAKNSFNYKDTQKSNLVIF